MNDKRFDVLTKLFSRGPLNRREALARGGAGLAAVSLAAGMPTTLAQGATPQATADPTTPAKVPFLFVQTYQSGTIAPKTDDPDRYTLTLDQGHGQTIYFSDRPDRIVGTSPTPQFLEGLGFPEDNPPNAALVVETAPGETDVAVIELFNPLYDPVSQGVTYEIELLANWQAEVDLELTETPVDLASLPASFGSAQLFIDDCSNSDIDCFGGIDPIYRYVGTASANADMCWNYLLCQPCEPYGHTYPEYCAGYDYWKKVCTAKFGHLCHPERGCDVAWSYFPPLCW